VDDQDTMRQVITHILRQLGFEYVKSAPDAKLAFHMIKKINFDLVISDWHMPGMTGLQLLKAIRQTEGIKDTPVLLVTSDSTKGHVIEAVKAGVNNFISKPFSGAELEKKIALIFPALKTKKAF
jgi:two-component system chemotaxis response regulator CheY